MATLNTLRTKFGVVLSAVIAFALLAFIFSLKSEMGFAGNDPIVAKINGQDVTYTEYYNTYEEIQRQSGMTEIDEQQANALYTATWQMLVTNNLILPGIQSIGFDYSESERLDVIRGIVPTQSLYNAFSDPNTGNFDAAALNNFLFMSQGSPEAEAVWSMIMNQAREERLITKYANLVNAGVYANALEVAEGVDGANKSFTGRFAVKRYSSIADSEVSVSDAEVKSYYDAHKSDYRREPSRTISYAEFNIEPTTSDLQALESKAIALSNDFDKADDIRMFVRESRSGSVAANYVSVAAMSAEEAEALNNGDQYGPSNTGTSWVMSRANRVLFASDTLSVSHIVLPYTNQELADSLFTALKAGTDRDFKAAAIQHSIYAESANMGGELGEIPFSAFTDEFVDALAPARKGQVVKVESGDMIQIIRVDEAGPRVKHYQVATLEVPIIASQDTRTAAHSAAGIFASEAIGGGSESFKNAASNASVSSHSVDLTGSTRTISAVAGSSEIVRWAHKAKIGDVSEIFKVDGGYVVAMLTGINDATHSSLKDVESYIRSVLISEKKFAKLSNEVSGSTFESQVESLGVESSEFDDVNYNSYFVAGVGVEPRLIGAISTTSTGVVSAPIKGVSGLFVYVVDSVNDSSEPQSADAEQLRLEMARQQVTQQSLFDVLESMGEIEDLRGAVL